MHCIVPFAAPASEAGRAALAAMPWARLEASLARLTQVERDDGEPTTFTPPHERVLARVHGWQGGDGRFPFAAQAARADGVDAGDRNDSAWGFLSPVHWHVGSDHVNLVDPDTLALDEATSRALFAAVQPLVESAFEGRGARLVYGRPTRWYVAHESLAALRTASLDRVAGRNVDPWLGVGGGSGVGGDDDAAQLRPWRRLQAEVQMLLHTHPLNAEREATGALPVNSFWLSGCGRAQADAAPRPVRIDTTLRAAALAEDWPAWAAAWRRLEEGVLRDFEEALGRGNDVALTLAGERAAVTFAPRSRGVLARLQSVFGARTSVPALLASL